jgi:hypothetical protein
MQITYQGTEYGFEVQKVTVDEWRELKRKYGMSPKKFSEGLDEADPDAYTFAYWVMLRQNGQGGTLTLGDHLKPDIIALNNAFGEAAQNEPEAPEEPEDPTRVSPSTPTSPGPAASPPAPDGAVGGGLTA